MTATLLRKFLWIVIILIAVHCTAQNSIYNPAAVWKKEVTREIEVRAPGKTTHSKGAPKDSSLAEMMTAAIFGGWIACYSDVDQTLTMRETADELYVILGLKPPSPGKNGYTGKHIADGSHSKFSYDSIYRYRLLEEWAYNPSTGVTDIHITGIAPVRNYYLDGEFIGKQAIFWMRYADAAGIIERYNKKNKKNSFTANIWNDYFSNGTNNKGAAFKTTVSRTIDLANKEDSFTYHLKDVNTDSTLMAQVGVLIAQNKINIYDSAGNPRKKEDCFPMPDTTIVIDPVTRQEMQAIIPHDLFANNAIHNIRVIEKWVFNTTTGDIQIKMENIVPFISENDLCWLRFDDVKDVITRYEHTHPANNFATKIWDSYFYSDTKPAVIK